MDPRVEQILLAAAVAENDAKPSIGEATIAGAIPGAAAGAVLGSVPHSVGRLLNSATGRQARPLKPGFRMAGGLVGAILGGGLGMGTRQMMIQNSPAAQILAKAQSGQEMNDSDKVKLAGVLEDTYSQMGLR
tara:strand:- start:210 stop:605 length:396 start_codon:yes stop_codon:yes gene_type:complete